MASVALARPIGLRRKPSPSHAKWPQIPLCARFRSHPRRTITAPHRPRPASIPIAPAAPPAITSRDFVPWRFSDAGHTRADRSSLRRPRNLHSSGHLSRTYNRRGGNADCGSTGRRFAQPRLSAVVGRLIERLGHPRCWSRSGRFWIGPPFRATSVGVHGCPRHI